MTSIRLLSTDFDGTLIGGKWGDSCAPTLGKELSALNGQGALWAVNTGRSLDSALAGIRQLGAPVMPDYILTNERHIHHPDGAGGWIDYGDWNRICRQHHDLLFSQSGDFFEQIRELADKNPGVTVLDNCENVPEGLMATSEALLDAVMLELNALPGRHDDFNCQRSDIYVRFCHSRYDKGSTLAELSRLLDMPTTSILAIGDHQNDLAMLQGDAASMVACPWNAHPSVKETVLLAGGYISPMEAGEGTADAIHLLRTGRLTLPIRNTLID